jgi:hypothetical protein
VEEDYEKLSPKNIMQKNSAEETNVFGDIMQFMKFMDNNMEQNEGLYRQQNKIKQETH